LSDYADKTLPTMQASVYGKRRVLPALSRALHVESGIVDEFGLSADDDCAAFCDDFVLAVFLYEFFYKISFSFLLIKT